MDLANKSASELATECLAEFGKCLTKKPLTHNQWAENRRADFNLWVDGVGAMAGKKASLDDRFQSRPRELTLTKSLLVRLRTYLQQCQKTDEVHPWEEAKRNADAAIDNLASVAVAIRQTGRQSRLLKANRNFDPHTLDDFRKYLKCLILVQSTRGDQEHQHWHQDEPLWWDHELQRETTPLQERLIDANLRRRNRFLYAQRHSRKLAYRPPPSSQLSESSVPGSRIESPHRQTGTSTGEDAEKDKVQDTRSTLREVPLTLSATSASLPASEFRWGPPQEAVKAPKTQITSITGSIKYPKLRTPHKLQVGNAEYDNSEKPKILKCPCCCEALPYTMLESETAWKNHLSLDISPYTCIAEDCPEPHVLYRKRAEWEDHVRTRHPKKWKCQLCEISGDICYSSVGQLVQHVSEEHQDSFPNELLHAVPLWPSTPSIGLDTCPLCPSTGPTDAPILIDHVLEHTHDFALLSLPWADLPIEDSQGSTSFCYLELLQRSESEAPSLSRHMATWFENLGKPLSAQSNAVEAALSNLTESRKKRDCQQDRGHFATNDYFASEAEDSPMTSSSSFGTPSSVEENTSLENTQIELRELNTGGELSEHMPKSESSSSRPKADQEPETNRSPALSETDNEGIANDGGDHDISRSVVASTTVDPSTCPAGEGSSFTHETRSHVHESSPSPDRGRSSSHVAAANAETIDPRYRVEHSSEFQPGKIIKVLLYHTQETDALSENLHHYFRRFIVIANHGEYSTCVPIRSYGGEACTRQGVEPENHGVVYRNTARVLAQERPLGFPPVKVKMTVEDESLGDECRINYSNLVDIGHDLKVLFIGRVTTRSFRIVKYAVRQCCDERDYDR